MATRTKLEYFKDMLNKAAKAGAWDVDEGRNVGQIFDQIVADLQQAAKWQEEIKALQAQNEQLEKELEDVSLKKSNRRGTKN